MYSASRRSAIFDALASEYLHVNTITKLLPSRKDAAGRSTVEPLMEDGRYICTMPRRETQDKAERVSVITGREMKWEGREKGEARKVRRRATLSRGSREMNHIIMNNNMPYPWCSLCLVINSNDLAGDFARIVGVVCRVKHALLPCVTPYRPARTLPLLLQVYMHIWSTVHVSMSARPTSPPLLYLSPLSRTYVVRNASEKKK